MPGEVALRSNTGRGRTLLSAPSVRPFGARSAAAAFAGRPAFVGVALLASALLAVASCNEPQPQDEATAPAPKPDASRSRPKPESAVNSSQAPSGSTRPRSGRDAHGHQQIEPVSTGAPSSALSDKPANAEAATQDDPAEYTWEQRKEDIDAAAAWLARNQEADGSWLCRKHGGTMSDEAAIEVTGLALFVLLGARHTEDSGIHSDNVKRAISYLKSRQNEDGGFGVKTEEGRGNARSHAIAGLALSEAFGSSNVHQTGAAAQRAVDYSCAKLLSPSGIWGQEGGQVKDLELAAWLMLQIRTARFAGMRTDAPSLGRMVEFIQRVELKDEVYNGHKGGIFSLPGQSASAPVDNAAGMVIKLLLGWPRDSVNGGQEILKAHPPNWKEVDFRYLYLGTLAFHFGGSSDEWDVWAQAMQRTLLPHQCSEGAQAGSWPPRGHYAKRAGRVYSTALGAMCLETYFIGRGVFD